jgi:protease-4
MSPPHREMANALLDGVSQHFIGAVATARKLDEAKVRAAIDAALVTPEELRDHGLINGIAFTDEVLKMQGERPLVKGSAYGNIDPASVGFAPVATFALVYGTGPVVIGEADQSLRQRDELASETVSKSIREAAEDAKIAAIILRIDSPGGSALASDIVWRAVQQAREKKPVVVSMSDLAASGGYYVACGADAIIAQPNTLTGSIGVFVLRPMLAGALEKLGIGYASLQRGEHADLLLSGLPLSDGTRERLAAEVRSVYEQFIGRVAQGRRLSTERVDEIGRGRVWTGEQALGIGLVDGLGGVRVAVAKAREKVGLAADADVALVPYPAPKPLAQQIGEMLEGVAMRAARSAVGLPAFPPLLQRAAAWVEAAPMGAPLMLSPFVVEIH